MQEEIKAEMQQRGMTSEMLATALRARNAHVTAEAVRAWCQGRAMPNYSNACAMAEVFGWSRDRMMELAGIR
jgi:ribosome-binding protein aMBF1 (putative translation factor)